MISLLINFSKSRILQEPRPEVMLGATFRSEEIQCPGCMDKNALKLVNVIEILHQNLCEWGWHGAQAIVPVLKEN